MTYFKMIDSPLGKITLTSDGQNLTGLYFEKQKYSIDDHGYQQNLKIFDLVEEWLKKYFQGNICPFAFSLSFQGTPFQTMVWQKLLEIPYGHTISYDELAIEIARITGKKKCPQAIGQAVAHNPIGIIVPCHRVVGKNGNLTGYAGGIEKKVYLLQKEKVDLSKYYIQERK